MSKVTLELDKNDLEAIANRRTYGKTIYKLLMGYAIILVPFGIIVTIWIEPYTIASWITLTIAIVATIGYTTWYYNRIQRRYKAELANLQEAVEEQNGKG